MKIGKAIYKILSDNIAVSSMVGTRIAPNVMKQTSPFPFIVYDVRSSNPEGQKDSVALCIRFYEETSDPALHADPFKKNKTINHYNNLIKKFEEKLENPYFFIFVQEENLFTNDLIFSSHYEFVTHKKGYIGSWQRLKSQSLCENHIFNNSTFYYWGAFLSEINNNNNKRMVYIADNFLFRKIYNPKWKTF